MRERSDVAPPAAALFGASLEAVVKFVIGGYTPPEGSRKYFGALLVGYYGAAGLLFAGRVGTGFSEKALAHLYEGMKKIKRTSCPSTAKLRGRIDDEAISMFDPRVSEGTPKLTLIFYFKDHPNIEFVHQFYVTQDEFDTLFGQSAERHVRISSTLKRP